MVSAVVDMPAPHAGERSFIGNGIGTCQLIRLNAESVDVDLQEDDEPDRYWYRCPETFRKNMFRLPTRRSTPSLCKKS